MVVEFSSKQNLMELKLIFVYFTLFVMQYMTDLMQGKQRKKPATSKPKKSKARARKNTSVAKTTTVNLPSFANRERIMKNI